MIKYITITLFLCTMGVYALDTSPTQPQKNLQHFVPSTISKGWKAVFEAFPDPQKALPMPKPDDLSLWQKIHQASEKMRLEKEQKHAQKLNVTVKEKDYSGVPTLIIAPKNLIDPKKIIVYTHGGAYTMLSAHSTLGAAAEIATHTGISVISVDYTNPPKAKWQEVTSQVITVLKTLLSEGYDMHNIAMMRDSAGGALAAGVVLKMRDLGMPLPSSLVLWSPWADITETGDTYTTLKDAEPRFIYSRVLAPSALAYADKRDLKHPYVSPVYGDFSKPFPPTLIQGGTREIFLSNFVRLYQALDKADKEVKLDLYEGMPHVFQATLPDAPESLTAYGKSKSFIWEHFKKK